MLNAEFTMCLKDALELLPSLLDDIVWDTEEHTNKLREMIYAKFYNYEISGETLQEQKLFMEQKFIQYRDYYSEMLSVYETEIAWLDGTVTTIQRTLLNESSDTNSSESEETFEYGKTEQESGTDTSTNTYGRTETTGGEDTRTVTKGIGTTTEVTRTETVTTQRYDLPRSVSTENRPSERVEETANGEPNTTTVTPTNGEDTDTVEFGKTFREGGQDSIGTSYGKKTTLKGSDTNGKNTSSKTTRAGEESESGSNKVSDLIKQKERMLALVRSLYSEFADKFKPCFIEMFY